MRRALTLLITLSLLIAFGSSALATELFHDDFSGVLTDNWTPFGSPLATIRTDIGLPAPCFDNNGDANYNSGAFTHQTFDYTNGLVIECDMYVPSNPSGCWTSNRMAICSDLTYSSTSSPGYAVWFTHQYSGAACWGDPDPKNEGELGAGIITETGEQEGFHVERENSYLDAWHRFRIEIGADRRVAFYIDGSLYYQTTGKLSLDYVNMPLLLDGRSHPTGKTYYDNLVVSTLDDGSMCSSILFTEWNSDYSDASLNAMTPEGMTIGNTGVMGWNATWSPDGSQITYVGNDPVTGKAEIFMMNADGSDVAQLTALTSTYGQNNPRFRGSDKIWFTWHGPGTGNSELYEMNTDGTGLRQLSNFVPTGKQFGHFDIKGDMLVYRTQNRSWSPTGEIFATDIITDGAGHETVDWAGSVQLTNNTKNDDYFDVSPDGSKVAFRRSEGASGYSPPNNIYTINIDGSNETKITFSTGTDDQYQAPLWSPDGSYLICAHYTGGQQDLFSMNPDGTNQINLTNTPDVIEVCSDWRMLPCPGESFADINGTVVGPDGGVLGVEIDLKDASAAIYGSVYTDETGAFLFTDIPNGDYTVEMHVPLGFTPVDAPEIAVVVDGVDQTVAFELAYVEMAKFRNFWWWKTQLAALRTDPAAHDYFTIDDVNGWLADIYQHFSARNDGNAISIEHVTYLGDPAGAPTFEDLCWFIMDKPTPADRQERYEWYYEKYLATLLLNFTSNRMSQMDVVTADGATVSQAVTYLTDIYNSGEYADVNTAFYNLRMIHLGDLIPAGVIPAGTLNIMYKDGEENTMDLMPTVFALNQNYPNPFNPTTEISFSLPEASTVRLEVYNVAGQRVATLVSSEKYSAGNHTVTWDANGTASGVYFYRLEAGNFTDSRKMILLK
ncbi:MAG: T9SS type A sorting domain-containing protein [candidate division Zixibacteria bacterium]|nr:T9SS type A sorting domain-containing protein [candidate division Zixibacteria bacterium]